MAYVEDRCFLRRLLPATAYFAALRRYAFSASQLRHIAFLRCRYMLLRRYFDIPPLIRCYLRQDALLPLRCLRHAIAFLIVATPCCRCRYAAYAATLFDYAFATLILVRYFCAI